MVDKDKWQKFSSAEKMGNIGSEMIRMMNLKEKQDKAGFKSSAERALELVDLTIMGGNPPKEVFRLRDIITDLYLGQQNFKINKKGLNSYFLPFAYLVRNKF